MTYVISMSGTPPTWTLRRHETGGDHEEVQVSFLPLYHTGFGDALTREEVLEDWKNALQRERPRWLTIGFEECILDLDALRDEFPKLSSLRWFRGKVARTPEVTILENPANFDVRPQSAPPDSYISDPSRVGKVVLRVVPEVAKKAEMLAEAPLGIHHSLANFRLDFPKPEDVAFIIMRFGTTDAHTLILEGIKKALATAGLTGIRADEKQYHDDLFNNVLTFMHGCGFGIAVFEGVEENDFNPNVALEVGYMLALRKPVCILKDRKLQVLQTDLMGKLYGQFDLGNPVASISESLSAWLKNKKWG